MEVPTTLLPFRAKVGDGGKTREVQLLNFDIVSSFVDWYANQGCPPSLEVSASHDHRPLVGLCELSDGGVPDASVASGDDDCSLPLAEGETEEQTQQ